MFVFPYLAGPQPDAPNSYKLCSNIPELCAVRRLPKYVEFRTGRPDLPLPSPRYLEIHAAVCRIAHMSGAADYYHGLDDEDPYMTKL